jgi:hypothetical protein
MPIHRRNKLAACAAGLVLAIVAGAAGMAAIPSTSGRIDGCVSPKNGALRVVDTEAGQTCAPRETAISWSSQPGAGPRAYGFVTVATDPIGTPLAADVDERRSVGLTDQMVRLWKSTDGNESYQFCFDVPFEVQNISATSADLGKAVSARVGDCGDGGATDFIVEAWSPSHLGELTSFYIVLR